MLETFTFKKLFTILTLIFQISKFTKDSEIEVLEDDTNDKCKKNNKQKCASDSGNFYDGEEFLYTISNNLTTNAMYFRCKNSSIFNCNARAKCKGQNLNEATLTRKHKHSARVEAVVNAKFLSKLHKNIRKDPFELGRKLYLRTMNEMKEVVDRK